MIEKPYLYSDIPTKEKYKLKNQDYLINSVNSMHYLCDSKYDLIIVDEVETVWCSFKGDAKTHRAYGLSNWKCFMRMMKDSKKCIIMDALLSNKTINIVNANENSELDSEILTLEKKQEPMEFFKYKTKEFDVWIKAIIKCIMNNEKVFIFMPYKMGNGKRDGLANIRSLMRNLCEICNLQEDEDVIGYFSEQVEQKNNLVNIEQVWSRARVIIANTCIAVGNNYSGTDFKHIFAYYAGWVEIRDFFQILKRVRNPCISKTIHVYYEKSYGFNDRPKLNELQIPDNESFDALKLGFSIEDKTSNKDKLDVISSRCNIANINKNEVYSIVKQQRLDISLSDYSIAYNDIPDVDIKEYHLLLTLVNTSYNSLLQALKIEKFLLKNKFLENTPEQVLEWFWNNSVMLERLDILTRNPEHLINKIFGANGLSIFDLESVSSKALSTIKIPAYISNDEVKKCFELHHPIQKRDMVLVQRLFNGFFGNRYLIPETNEQYVDKLTGNKKWKYVRVNIDKVQVLLYILDFEPNGYKDILKSISLYVQHSKLYKRLIIDKPNNVPCLIE